MTEYGNENINPSLLLETIVEGSSSRYFWKDKDGRFLGCNALFAKDAGVAHPNELIGKTDADLAWKDRADQYRADELEVMATNTPKLHVEEPQTKADGSITWLHSSKLPMRDHDGNITGILGFYDIISELPATDKPEELQKLHQDAQKLAQLGYWHLNLQTNHLYWSDEIFHIFEIDPKKFAASYEAFVEAVHPEDRENVTRAYEESVQNQTQYDITHRLQMQDGRIKWVHENCYTTYDSKGNPIASIGTVQDITALKQSELQTQAIIATSTDGFLKVRADNGRLTEVNDAYCRMSGWSRDKLIQMTIYDLDSAMDPDTINRKIKEIVKSGSALFESTHRHKDGHSFNVEISISCPDTVQGLVFVRDITERKQAEEKLRISEESYRGLLDSISEAVCVHGEDFKFIYVNEGFVKQHGFSRDEVLGKSAENLLPTFNNDMDEINRKIKKAFDGEPQSHIANVNHANGEVFPVEAHFYPGEWHGQKALFVVTTDITERLRAETLLRERESALKESQRLAHLGSWNMDLETNEVFWSEELYMLYGFDPSLPPPLFTDSQKLFTHESWEKLSTAVSRTVETGEGYELEIELINNLGERKWMQARGELIRDTESKPVKLQGTVLDITKRKLAELKLAESERRSNMAQAIGGVGVWDWNPNTDALYWSDECFRIMGLEPRSITYQEFLTMLTDESRPVLDDAVQKALHQNVHYNIEVSFIYQKDQSVRYAQAQGALVVDAENLPVHMVGTFQDITEKRFLEDQARQSQKMEAVGTLVGGIAHDFNNVLAAIHGNLYLAKMNCKQIPSAMAQLQNIEKLTDTSAEMVRQLLTFARKDSIRMNVFLLTSFMKESFKLNRLTIPENIDMQLDFCAEPLSIRGDITQLQQVLMNLINNARDAVCDAMHPSIKCDLSVFTADKSFKQQHPEHTAIHYAKISISDNGTGIPEENINRVFEPFFTTKEVGKGTGLGLSMVFGAIKNHDGEIEVESTWGEGTTFHIYIPLVEEEISGATDTPLNRETMKGGGETILIADDNQKLRETTAQVLEAIGYHVLQADNGQQALQLLQQNSNDISLLLSDIIMPVMGGETLVAAARELNNSLPIILITGYEKSDTIKALETIPNLTVLTKPFNVKELAELIQSMIAVTQ